MRSRPIAMAALLCAAVIVSVGRSKLGTGRAEYQIVRFGVPH